MNPTQLLLILAIILFIVAAVGTYVAKPAMIAMGWVGLAVVALATVVG